MADTVTAEAVKGVSFTQADVDAVVVRHYVHESSRTASFLIADIICQTAALIDPTRYMLDSYEHDLNVLGLQLTHLVVTHCFVDAALCVQELTDRHPTASIVSGVEPVSSDGCDVAAPPSFRVRPAGEAQDVVLSERLVLRAVSVPSFSPESLMVEMKLRGTLVALFTGTAWGTDAAPRADLYDAFSALAHPSSPASAACGPFTAAGNDDKMTVADVEHTVKFFPSREAMTVAQASLKTFFFDRYLFPSVGAAPIGGNEEGGEEDCDDLGDAGAQPNNLPLCDRKGRYDRVVLFPSHGGYSNVSNQLDLYWAIHLGDLKRMRHARTVVDTLLSPDAYVAYAKQLPALPRPLLFQANRRYNLRSLLSLPAEAPASPPVRSPYPVVVLDTRDAAEYHRLHLRGAVNVPFSFPGAAYGSKRAELWLQCLLLPTQPILAIVNSAEEKTEVGARLRAVAPQAPSVAVFTVADLLQEPSSAKVFDVEQAIRTCTERGASGETDATHTSQAMRVVGDETYFTAPVPQRTSGCVADALSRASMEVDDLCWVACTAGERVLARIDAPEKLAVLDPNSDGGGDSAKKRSQFSSPECGPEEGTKRTLVVDVRTPYEFKQGSHQRSVHLQLSELCQLTTETTRKQALARLQGSREESNPQTAVTRCVAADPSLARVLFNTLLESAMVSGVMSVGQGLRDVDRIAVYCAGGYRSLIAASLLRRALELAVDVAVPPDRSAPGAAKWDSHSDTRNGRGCAAEEAREPELVLNHLAGIPIVDVAGGAFAIMTHRPDLWVVKDRSIICIS